MDSLIFSFGKAWPRRQRWDQIKTELNWVAWGTVFYAHKYIKSLYILVLTSLYVNILSKNMNALPRKDVLLSRSQSLGLAEFSHVGLCKFDLIFSKRRISSFLETFLHLQRKSTSRFEPYRYTSVPAPFYIWSDHPFVGIPVSNLTVQPQVPTVGKYL